MIGNLISNTNLKLLFILSMILILSICFTTINTFAIDSEETTNKSEGTVAEEKKDGECIEGDCKNGKGTKTYPDGTKYTGDFKDGRRDGKGTYSYSDGGNYTGDWKDNLRHGKGTDTFTNGITYEGEWQLDKRHGQGTLEMPELGTYVGEWKEGKKHGYGTFTLVDGGKYEGEWVEGACEGKGTHTFANGNKYVGKWEGFAAIGGWYYWPDGNKTWSYMNEKLEWVHRFSKPRN